MDLNALMDMIQEAIDNGATSVEQVHRAIAAKPFDVLAKIGPISDKVEMAKGLNDMTLGNAYQLIRDLNGKIRELAGIALEKAGK